MLGIDAQIVRQLLKLGTGDLAEIPKLSKEYGVPYPTEIKMWYDVSSGEFNADYKYEEVCSARTGVSSGMIFMEWYEEEKNKVGRK